MRRPQTQKKPHPSVRVRETAELCVLGVVLIAAGLVLLFLCIPGWAWAAMIGAALVAAGFWLLMAGRR